MKMLRRLLAGFSCAMLAACASRPPEKITAVLNYNAAYVCENDLTAQVHFSPFNAVLESQGQSVAMVQQPAADGYFYAGGGQSVRARGAEATWTDDKGVIHHCRDAKAASPKAPAR
jgi:membrane-bound inhibitor of C-type lysozyme